MSLKQKNDFINEILELIQQIIKPYKEKNNIFCLSEDYNNDAMWYFYAFKHQGFCIEYNFEKIFDANFDNTSMFFYLWPIIYDKNKKFDMFEFIKPILLSIIENKDNKKLTNSEIINLNMNLFTKSYSWRWQKEWRFFKKLDANENKILFPFISSIYIGKNMTEDNKKRILDISKINKYKVYQQEMNRIGSAYEYNLIYEPIK